MRQYSADTVDLNWAGIDLSEGLAEGTFLQIKRNALDFRLVPDGMGGIVRVPLVDKSGTASLQIDAESRTHQVLVTLSNTDLLTRSVVFPMFVKDRANGEIVVLSKTSIIVKPDFQKGTQMTVYSWEFAFEAEVRQSFNFDGNVAS